MRNYVRKTERGKTPADTFERAAKLIIENEGDKDYSIRKVATDFNIHYSTLSRYIAKLKKSRENDTHAELYTYKGYAKNRQVFTNKQELILMNYIKRSSEIMFGLTPACVRILAFQCAELHQNKMPESWIANRKAGVDWFNSFMKRNSDLSIRQPEATSLARATSFNATNVALFFDKLSEVFSRYSFQPSSIWNMDETGVSTVLRPNKIVAQKGVKQVGAITSGERGEMITVAAAVNAQGNSIPLMFIFPRKRYKDHFIRDGPPGCIGNANGSGWMQEPSFVIFIKHFITHTKATKESPVILLLDNHSSHLSCSALSLCKDNGVIMASFPPHCSHRLQPLDLTVFGPFKKLCSSGISAWLRSNPGKTLTIYDLPGIIKHAYLTSATPSNIISGFQAAGIFPLNPNIFNESDFASAFVTDRPNPVENEKAGPSGIQTLGTPTSSKNSSQEFSPETLRPLPKAPARKENTNRGRKRRRAAILTDTPEKSALEEEEKLRNIKKGKTKGKQREAKTKTTRNIKKKTNVVRKIFKEDSTDDSD